MKPTDHFRAEIKRNLGAHKMTTFEKKLDLLGKLHREIGEHQANLRMKTAQFEDLMKDIAQNELGFDKDAKEVAIHELMLKSYQKVHV